MPHKSGVKGWNYKTTDLMNNTEIQSILQALGERVQRPSRLVLVGGSALALLGSPRLTIDIDFVGDDLHPNELHRSIIQIAKELQVHVEPVPLNALSLYRKAATNAIFVSVNLGIWKSMLPIHIALL